jgi:uracil-DNA glycosylase family 4
MPRDKLTPSGRVARIVAQQLESFQRAGVTHLRKPPSRRPPAPSSSQEKPSRPVSAAPGTVPVPNPGHQAVDRAAALEAMARKVAKCVRCKELARHRTQTVFGVGNPFARLVFMGEAPGEDEDRQGIPFVGRAGQLLTDIIVKGMGLRREDIYILNTIKCRPPGNRAPLPDEAANCREYLDFQLEVIRPEFICCLGAVAAQNLLGSSASIGSLRGRVHLFNGIKVVCTYHPAYVLRYPPAKRQVWEDIQLLMKEMAVGRGQWL